MTVTVASSVVSTLFVGAIAATFANLGEQAPHPTPIRLTRAARLISTERSADYCH